MEGPHIAPRVGVRNKVVLLACVAAVLAHVDLKGQRPAEKDPFEFFAPVVRIDSADRHRIDGGEVVVRILPARDHEVAVFAASKFDDEADGLVRWTHAIEQLKRGPFVMAIKRFSDPPVLSDLDALELDDVDLEAVARCRTGDCDLKLAAHDIETLRAAAANGGDWKPAVQRQFRRVVFDRVSRYLSEGFAALPAYADQAESIPPRDQLAGFLERSPYLRGHLPAIADGLVRYPQVELPHTQSFLYWSKEQYSRGKPVIAVTQVHIVRPVGPLVPKVLVLAQEVFASHYRDGSLGTTFVLENNKSRYLAYLNRSRLDRLDGLFGLKRQMVERKLGNEVKTAIEVVRRRIEGGDPAATASR